jgi:hypothetical protein
VRVVLNIDTIEEAASIKKVGADALGLQKPRERLLSGRQVCSSDQACGVTTPFLRMILAYRADSLVATMA